MNAAAIQWLKCVGNAEVIQQYLQSSAAATVSASSSGSGVAATVVKCISRCKWQRCGGSNNQLEVGSGGSFKIMGAGSLVEEIQT